MISNLSAKLIEQNDDLSSENDQADIPKKPSLFENYINLICKFKFSLFFFSIVLIVAGFLIGKKSYCLIIYFKYQ
jgi:hypothetical protein